VSGADWNFYAPKCDWAALFFANFMTPPPPPSPNQPTRDHRNS
jgi:hypothetical protein